MVQAFFLSVICAVLASIPAFALFHCVYPQASILVQICFGFLSLVCFGISALFAPLLVFGFFKGSSRKQSVIEIYAAMVLVTFFLPFAFVIVALIRLFKKNRGTRRNNCS